MISSIVHGLAEPVARALPTRGIDYAAAPREAQLELRGAIAPMQTGGDTGFSAVVAHEIVRGRVAWLCAVPGMDYLYEPGCDREGRPCEYRYASGHGVPIGPGLPTGRQWVAWGPDSPRDEPRRCADCDTAAAPLYVNERCDACNARAVTPTVTEYVASFADTSDMANAIQRGRLIAPEGMQLVAIASEAAWRCGSYNARDAMRAPYAYARQSPPLCACYALSGDAGDRCVQVYLADARQRDWLRHWELG